MNFTSTLEKIEKSKTFKNFKEKNKTAKLCAGFFVLGKGPQQQLDYCLEDSRIFTFILNEVGEVIVKEAEVMKKQSLPAIEKNIKVDLEDAQEILKEQIKEKKIPNKLNKIIAVLQKNENKQIWNLNCVLSGMEILRVHIDTESGDVLKFEKKSMFEFIKKVK